MTDGLGAACPRAHKLGCLCQSRGKAMKRVLLAAALVAASVGGVQGAFAQNMPVQERVDLDMTGRIEAQLERFAPGFRDLVLARHTMNCADYERYNPNLIGGDIVGGMTDWTQLLTRPVVRSKPHTTPNPAIFLCSASTPPGGGVHGMCGYWAAREALGQLRSGS